MTDSTNKPACVIVGLDEVMADAPMPLIDIRAAQPDDDILISWQVEMDVKGRGKERYHVCFGGWSEDSLEALQTISQQICEPEHRSVFGYINVLAMGLTDLQFLQTPYGEVLVDRLVNEIVESWR